MLGSRPSSSYYYRSYRLFLKS